MKYDKIKFFGGPLHNTLQKCTEDVELYSFIDSLGNTYKYTRHFYEIMNCYDQAITWPIMILDNFNYQSEIDLMVRSMVSEYLGWNSFVVDPE